MTSKFHPNGHVRHPYPRRRAAQLLANGWSSGSIEAWYREVSLHNPGAAEAWILPLVRQARVLEGRAARGQ